MTHPLLDRLRSATCGSRELDAELALRFGWETVPPEGWWKAPRSWKKLDPLEGLPFFTTSLDATLGLVERVLPGQDLDICRRMNGPYLWSVKRYVPEDGHWLIIGGRTAPLALLIALLTAPANKEGNDTP